MQQKFIYFSPLAFLICIRGSFMLQCNSGMILGLGHKHDLDTWFIGAVLVMLLEDFQ